MEVSTPLCWQEAPTQRPSQLDLVKTNPQAEAKKLVPTKLSELKEPMFENIAKVLVEMQTEEFKAKLSKHAWQEGCFEKVFDLEFQREAVRLVAEDTAGKFFAKRDGELVEPPSVFPAGMVAAQDIIDHVDELSNLVGRKVEAWNGWPGKVDKFFVRTQQFQIRYYDPENEHKRAKKLSKVSHSDLLELLLDDESIDEDEVLPEEEEMVELSSDEESGDEQTATDGRADD